MDAGKLREALDATCPANVQSANGGIAYANAIPFVALQQVRAAAEAHLATLPKTKTVKVWRIEWAQRHHVTGEWQAWSDTWPNKEHLLRRADDLREEGCACIRITGPHKHQVPA